MEPESRQSTSTRNEIEIEFFHYDLSCLSVTINLKASTITSVSKTFSMEAFWLENS